MLRPRSGEIVDWPQHSQQLNAQQLYDQKLLHDYLESQEQSAPHTFMTGANTDSANPATTTTKSKSKVAEIGNTANSNRVALYEENLAKQRRNAKYYVVEVREPSARDVREHRLSGYYR
jgi:hypothetical protein